MSVLPDVHFGEVGGPAPDWRATVGLHDEPDDDELLDSTPEDVIGILGFDPLNPDIRKGGPGSGSWEGPGDPRFAHEGGGTSTGSEGGIFYHGTHEKLFDKVLAEGIQPQSTHTFEEDEYYTGD